jgi:hypothetical protein
MTAFGLSSFEGIIIDWLAVAVFLLISSLIKSLLAFLGDLVAGM